MPKTASPDPDSLITPDEAEEVADHKVGFSRTYRAILMVIVGTLAVATATILIMLLLSLRGSRTGLEAIFPFLGASKQESLQVN